MAKTNVYLDPQSRKSSRCLAIKEELMIIAWNPERPYAEWLILEEYNSE